MQPLSYQLLPYSCWVTSMLNGLIMLYGDKNKMPGLVYRLLHALLTDEGVDTQGKLKSDMSTVLEAVQIRTGLRVSNYLGVEVEGALRKLNFKNQVAVCDIDAGGHAILLLGKSNGWIEAFDPDWDSVRRKRSSPNAYQVRPDDHTKCRRGQVNVLIEMEYLIRPKGRHKKGFKMGAVKCRSLTVMEKR